MSERGSNPSIFDAFNARALNPIQVAETFIPPKHYGDLVKPVHSIIIGPRGSGKTTLLKMLQPPALEAWRHPDADRYRQRVDFTGVFVPTDIGWSEQMKALGEHKLAETERRLFGTAAFTTQVLHALVESIEYRVHASRNDNLAPHRRVSITRSEEAKLVTEVARNWHLDLPIPSLLSLKHSLTARLGNIKELTIAEVLLGPKGRGPRLAEVPYLLQHFLTSAIFLVEIFNDLAKEPRGKWALLFDELELAPKSIREELVRSLRSVDDRWLFKLSISPYSQDLDLLESASSAMPGNDYEAIPLWYPYKEDSYEFCHDLFYSMLEQKGLPLVEPNEVFGSSEFETSKSEMGAAYRPGSRLQKRFVRMAKRDQSFREYLQDKDVDLNSMHLLPEDERAALVRKITPLVTIRESFRSVKGEKKLSGESKVRSRKNPALYRGAKSLFAIVEGNPRWFIGIVGNLLDSYALTRSSITPARQGSEVIKAVNKFRALLRTIPSPAIKGKQKPRGVLSIIDLIGEYIFDEVVRADFNPDAVGSFMVDSHVSSELTASLGRALNAGAIIYIPSPDDDSQFFLGSLKGKRFRLSYLLAPHYGLPLRLGDWRSLKAFLGIVEEPSLFSELEKSNE
jgi:hypothetical protein